MRIIGEFQAKVRLLSWNFTPFPVHFDARRAGEPRLTDALLTRQLPALNPATGSSPSDIHDKSLPRGLCHCHLGLCVLPTCHLCSPEAFARHLRDLVDSPVVQIWWSHAHGQAARLCLIIRLRGIQGHTTYVCRLGMKMTAPSPSVLHY